MANELSSNSIVMADALFADIKSAVKSLRSKMSFLTVYSDEEVSAFNKTSDGDKIFISDCLTEAPECAPYLTAYINPSEIADDDKAHDQLWELEDIFFELYVLLRRNRMAAGDKSYSGVSSIYELLRVASSSKKAAPEAKAIFARLQSYHLKRVEMAKANKKKVAGNTAAAVAAAVAAKEAELAAKAATEK